MSGSSDAPSDLLRERARQSRAKLWLLLEADRWIVTVLLLAVVFGVLLAAGLLLPQAETSLRADDSVDTLFQGLLTATITGVTLVLTLNQLVLSQELGAVGDQRDRMEGAMEFRDDVAEEVDAPVSPARPAQFLRALVEISANRARALQEAVPGTAGGELAADVEGLTSSLIENAEKVSKGLDGARFGDFEVISSALNFNYSWKLFSARRILGRYAEELGDDATEALDGLVETLKLFGPAREHFKTLYFQWELTNLSNRILFASIPALVVSSAMIAFFNVDAYGSTLLGIETLVPAVVVAATMALLPFLILLAYILRIATVTKHTLSIGPFILRETEDAASVDWE